MKIIEKTTDSPGETFDTGVEIGKLAIKENIKLIVLKGDMGAGKTAIAKGIVSGLNIEDEVCSPTYSIVNTYGMVKTVHHMDLYRLNDIDELYYMGFEDYLEGDDLLIIEWAELAENDLIEKRPMLEVEIEVITEIKRKISVKKYDS
jgi:tRNA threonylcarbamoyladenosine biosynthesis protein TsaE